MQYRHLKSVLSINSRRDSPVQVQIYLLKIASIYGHFTPIGASNVLRVFLENKACAKSYQIYFESEKVCQKKTYLSLPTLKCVKYQNSSTDPKF